MTSIGHPKIITISGLLMFSILDVCQIDTSDHVFNNVIVYSDRTF